MSEQSLFDTVGLAPSLPGAACRGRHHLFDPPDADVDPEDAQCAEQTALKLCSWCPALARCSDWLDSLPPAKRPRGVVAGQINRPPRPGRPGRQAA